MEREQKESVMTRPTFELHIAAVEEYLKSAMNRRDWHAVSDAANDLRVLEAQRETFDTAKASE